MMSVIIVSLTYASVVLVEKSQKHVNNALLHVNRTKIYLVIIKNLSQLIEENRRLKESLQ